MQGYWNNPSASGDKLKRGWVYTGDLMSQDAEGFFHFHGRSDDMIVSGGENAGIARRLQATARRIDGGKTQPLWR